MLFKAFLKPFAYSNQISYLVTVRRSNKPIVGMLDHGAELNHQEINTPDEQKPGRQKAFRIHTKGDSS